MKKWCGMWLIDLLIVYMDSKEGVVWDYHICVLYMYIPRSCVSVISSQ